MKRWLMVTCALWGLSGCGVTTSSRITSLATPELHAPPDSVDVSAFERHYPGARGVWLDYDVQYEHTGVKYDLGSGEWLYYEVVRRDYLVLNADDSSLGQFSLRFPRAASLEQFFVRMTFPDGEVVLFDEADLIDANETASNVTKQLAYPRMERGVVIEEGFEIAYDSRVVRPPLSHEVPLQFVMPVEQLRFSYSYPDWWQIRIKRISETEALPLQTTSDSLNHKVTIAYEATDVPGLPQEPYSPPFRAVGRYIKFQVSDFAMFSNKWQAPASWKEVFENVRERADERPDGYLNDVLKRQLEQLNEELIEGRSLTHRQRFDAVLRYLQENINPATDYEKRLISRVLDDRMGNEFEICVLAEAMLEKAGVPCELVFLHDAHDGYFDDTYYDIWEASTPAILATVEGRQVVGFPYLPLESGWLPPQFIDQTAVVMRTGELVKLESPEHHGMEAREDYKVAIRADGTLRVTETKTFNEIMGYLVRSDLEELEEEEREEFVRSLLTYADEEVELESYEIHNLEDAKQRLAIELSYDIGNLVTVTPEEVLFHTNGLFAPASGNRFRLVDADDRQTPIHLDQRFQFSKHIEITYPESWVLASAIQDLHFENEFGSVQATYAVSGGALRVRQDLLLERISAPKESIRDFLDLAGWNSRLSIPTLVFQVNERGLTGP